MNKSLFEDFLQKPKNNQQQSTFEARDARVITPALPRTLQTMELARLVGLFLGIGGSIAKDKLNGGFAIPRQVKDMLNLPLLASVNIMDEKDLTVKAQSILSRTMWRQCLCRVLAKFELCEVGSR